MVPDESEYAVNVEEVVPEATYRVVLAVLTARETGVSLNVTESFLVRTPFEAMAKWTTEFSPWFATHCAELFLPHKIQPVVAPAPGNLKYQLVLTGPVVRPIVG